jgi:hypothetical protein
MAESDLRRWRNLPEMFLAQAERLADKPFLWRKNEGAFRPMRYGEAARQVRHLAGGLAALGVGAGDRWWRRTGRSGPSPISPSWRLAPSPCRPSPPTPPPITGTC